MAITRVAIGKNQGDMVFTAKIDPETRAFVRFAVKCKRMCIKDILQEAKILRPSLYRILNAPTSQMPTKVGQGRRHAIGRPRKLSAREERVLLREIPKLRKTEGKFTIKRLMQKAGLNMN